MAGLPPVPIDVARLELDCYVGGHLMSCSWWLRNDSWTSLSGSTAPILLNDFFNFCMPNLLGAMHDESSFGACRIAAQGFKYETYAPPNVGAFVGATEVNVATGLKWVTRERGRRSWSITYLPATPSRFIDGHWQLNETGWVTARDAGLNFMQQMNQLRGPDGTFCEMGTLQRRTALGPLPASLFVGYADVFSCKKVVTIGRRIPARSGAPPV